LGSYKILVDGIMHMMLRNKTKAVALVL